MNGEAFPVKVVFQNWQDSSLYSKTSLKIINCMKFGKFDANYLGCFFQYISDVEIFIRFWTGSI